MNAAAAANKDQLRRVIGETSVRDVSVEEVGAKAYNLMRMTEAGLPVPPGFVLGTGLCRAYHDAGGQLGEGVADLVADGVRKIQRATGSRFGARRRPLLVAVRSGAAVSMPGMLETVLDVGLSDATLPGLLRATGDPVFVWDSYRRLIQSYGEVVDGCPAAPFTTVLSDAMIGSGVPAVAELDVAALRGVVRDLQDVYESAAGHPFPQDPMAQLLGAVEAVLRSWHGARAAAYRELEGLTGLAGTAVIVQAMVFGNMGVTSGSGVGFTRDPATGEDRLYADFLLNAQGEDVVAGRHATGDPEPLIAALPGLAHELQTVRRRLEALFGDAQDFEFTVEEGKLWLLQTRTAKRTPWAALHIACDLVDEELIDPATAVHRLGDYDLDSITRVRLAAEARRAANRTRHSGRDRRRHRAGSARRRNRPALRRTG
jgi:pyruvate, orthophosphate dikinase